MSPASTSFMIVLGWWSSSIHLASARSGCRVRRASGTAGASLRRHPRYWDYALTHCAGWRILMRAVVSFILSAALLCVVPTSNAEPRQVMQGTQVHLTLLNSISTADTRDGDPFVAVVAQPVFLGNQLILPAGTRVNGYIGVVGKARRFSVIRGQAYMSLTFRSLEIDSRLIPVQMSIIAFEKPSADGEAGRRRRDLKVDEGSVVEQKHDYKGDVLGGTLGTGGGTLIG